MARLKRLIEPQTATEEVVCDSLGLSSDNLEDALKEIDETDADSYKPVLQDIVKRYFLNKTEFDSYKKLVDADNSTIKEVMLEKGIDAFEVDGITASCTTSTRESFDEEALLKIVKKARIKGLVKKKEYVDEIALENAIYNGEFDASLLESARVTKDVVTLKVSVKKKK